MATSVQSIPQFAAACENLDHNFIYDIFENAISQELRNEILQTFWCSNHTEPVRSAMIQMGARYNVMSLINY